MAEPQLKAYQRIQMLSRGQKFDSPLPHRGLLVRPCVEPHLWRLPSSG